MARKKVYVGGSMEQDESWNAATAKWETQETRVFVVSPVGVVGVYTQDATTPANTTSHYLFKDHLGSVVKVVDDDVLNPATVAEYSYDAWGKPRNATTWADDLTAWPDHETDRGFTGHEMLAGVELVHMNGRIYDPLLGRFLSADPFVQSPNNLQSYNRYSYVLNNPISFTDPSGFFFKKLFRAIGKAFKRLFNAIVVSFLYAIPVIGPYLALAYVAYVGYKANGIQGAIFAVLTYSSAPGGGGGGGPGGVVIWDFTGENNRNRSYGFYLKAIQLVAQIVFQKDEKRISVAPRIGGTKFYNGAATRSFTHMFQDKGRNPTPTIRIYLGKTTKWEARGSKRDSPWVLNSLDSLINILSVGRLSGKNGEGLNRLKKGFSVVYKAIFIETSVMVETKTYLEIDSKGHVAIRTYSRDIRTVSKRTIRTGYITI